MSQDNPVTWGRDGHVSPAFASKHDAYQRAEATAQQQGAIAGVGMCEPKQSDLARVNDRLTSQVQRTRDLASRLINLCERVYGLGPAGDETGATDRPRRSGRLGDVEEAIQDMADVLDVIEADLGRLEDLA